MAKKENHSAYINNTFTQLNHRHDNSTLKSYNMHPRQDFQQHPKNTGLSMTETNDDKWHYNGGNREDFYSNASSTSGDQAHSIRYSAEEKALVRKIDFMIMPMICVLDFLQFLDKSTISYAALMSFKTDLNLQGNQFSLLGSVFYLGYLLFQLPNNYLLQRFPLGKYIGILVFLWGTVLLCTAFGTNFSQIAAMRFLLGFFEAGIYPSISLLVSTFYRRSEQVARLGAFWLCNGLALCIGGFVSYGVGHMVNVGGLKSWQWIMIILGSITIVMGVITFFFLIDSPKASALKLNAEQEILVEERTIDNATVRTTKIKLDQIWEAVKEVRFWCFSIACLLINLQNGAMTIYNGQITASFGFDQLQSMLLTAGAGGSDVLFIAIGVYAVRKTRQTIYSACILMSVNIIGMILLLVIPVTRLKLLGFYLAWSYCSVYVLLVASISNNVSGYTKKIFYNGVLMIFYTVGNFVGPLMMVEPPYVAGMLGYLVANCVVIVLLLVARWRMAVVNRRRLLLLAHTSSASVAAMNSCYGQDDISDEQDQNFIYLL
ncbi:major facilitator superfamily domain-containing protein [Mycotypha africana]|uniref:major facilitator superfamily domain-containing protein n=1 Tax=Mycotypha africana TaxID=64632 RepID=UPI00230012B8|nr:major facilitator superfamily domain-containing protein [Mycotypha africana]KAI8967803.1 major facilitator superfamily domain-containing protein [Mycotypha africana]